MDILSHLPTSSDNGNNNSLVFVLFVFLAYILKVMGDFIPSYETYFHWMSAISITIGVVVGTMKLVSMLKDFYNWINRNKKTK